MKHNYSFSCWHVGQNVSFNLSGCGLGFPTTCVLVSLSESLNSHTGCTKCFFIYQYTERCGTL